MRLILRTDIPVQRIPLALSDNCTLRACRKKWQKTFGERLDDVRRCDLPQRQRLYVPYLLACREHRRFEAFSNLRLDTYTSKKVALETDGPELGCESDTASGDMPIVRPLSPSNTAPYAAGFELATSDLSLIHI